jgi:hypothetical protein
MEARPPRVPMADLDSADRRGKYAPLPHRNTSLLLPDPADPRRKLHMQPGGTFHAGLCRPIGHVSAFGPANGSPALLRVVRGMPFGSVHGTARPLTCVDRRFGAWRAASFYNNTAINCTLHKPHACVSSSKVVPIRACASQSRPERGCKCSNSRLCSNKLAPPVAPANRHFGRFRVDVQSEIRGNL